MQKVQGHSLIELPLIVSKKFQ